MHDLKGRAGVSSGLRGFYLSARGEARRKGGVLICSGASKQWGETEGREMRLHLKATPMPMRCLASSWSQSPSRGYWVAVAPEGVELGIGFTVVRVHGF